jgi:polysaccharide export outer membrane protein
VTSFKVIFAVLAAIALAACQETRPSQLPADAAAYAIAPSAESAGPPATRALRPGDEIAVLVFREPDLSVPKLLIDEQGSIQLPLIGAVEAAGTTTETLSGHIRDRYAVRYLRNPQVSVVLLSSVPNTVAVEGEVNQPGVYPITRGETLLSALSRARSPTRVARNDEVVVFRTVANQRMGARFDLDQIRAGRAADPQILDGDVIVVGFSRVKGGFRDFLQAAPLLNLFTVF